MGYAGYTPAKVGMYLYYVLLFVRCFADAHYQACYRRPY